MFASAGSWLAHTAWLTPLAAVITAVGAVATVLVAVYIGIQASGISQGQREIAGLSELNKIMDDFDKPWFAQLKR